MKAHLDDNLWIWFDEITENEEEILWEEFSVSRPNTYVDPTQRGMWDGVYRKYNKAKKRIARPLLSLLKKICQKRNLVLSLKDNREYTKYKPLQVEQITPDFLPGITLEPHQIRAIQAACKIECGIIDYPTGSGKGEIICGICKAIRCPTVVIADQTVVIDQLKARLELRQIDEEIGVFYAGKRPTGETIIVGSIQSLQLPTKPPIVPIKKTSTDEEYLKKLAKWDILYKAYRTRSKTAKYLQKYVRTADMIIVDECVDASAFITTDRGLIIAGDLHKLIQNGEKIKACVGGKFYDITASSIKNDKSLCVTTIAGRSLKTSGNHKFTIFDNGQIRDVYATDLKPGDLLLRNNYDIVKDELFDDKWYYIGLFIGDGHLLNGQQVKFGVRKDFADWRYIIAKLADRYDGTHSASINCRGDLVLRAHAPLFVAELYGLGFKRGRKMGLIDPKFTVPSRSAAIGLLQGLFDSEGSSYHDHANFDSSDLALAKFVQILLSYLGIGSSLYCGNKRNNPKHAIDWRVSVTSSDFVKFQNIINFRFRRKQRTIYINKLCSRRHIDSKPYLDKWLSIIPKYALINIIGNLPSGKIDLNRLITYQNMIKYAAEAFVGSYSEARIIYGISDKLVAKWIGVSVMTAYNIRKRGDNSMWLKYVDHIKSLLLEPIIDTSVDCYAVEPIATITNSSTIELVDFTVPATGRFEANSLLVHNCDKCSSNSYAQLFKYWFKGRRRYGMSGTPFDPDKPVEALIMQEHIGSVIAKESVRNLEKIGRIIPCTYYSIAFGIDGNAKEGSAYDIAKKEYMVENKKFHKLISDLCLKYKGDGTLVLVDAIELGHTLKEVLQQNGLTANFIYGKTSKNIRNETLRAFERREFDVLIGGKIINRGLDLKGGCENLIIATGGKLQSDFIQKVGRALRQNKRGSSRIFDFYFRCNRYLYNHSKARLKAIVGVGYKSLVVFPGGSVDGAELIKSRFIVKKKLLIRK